MIARPVQATVIDDNCNYLGPTAIVFGQTTLCLGSAGDTRNEFVFRVARVIGVFLSLLALVMVILILYGGYLWLTARGNESQVEEAQATIRNAIFGAIIILSSWVITAWLLYNVGQAVS